MKSKKILVCCLVFGVIFIFSIAKENFILKNSTTKYKLMVDENKVLKNNWYYNLDKLDKNNLCVNEIIKQINYLKNEKLSDLITFNKYPALIFTGEEKKLDISNSDSAKMFKTEIEYDLDNNSINFAGHYTIVRVGMTGWGENYWIVDRKTGKSFEFPYAAVFIDFKKDSNLIVINPKDQILKYMENSDNYLDLCVGNIFVPKYYELRPSYVIWENDKITVVNNPNNIQPKTNPFFE